MIDTSLKTLHLLGIIVWIGGMVFTHFFLRPSLTVLEPPARLALMAAVLGRFFKAVLWASLIVLGSGVWLLGRAAKAVVQSGGVFQMPVYWWLMLVLGTTMVAIFMHIRFAMYPRLTRAVAAGDNPAGAAALGKVRQWVAVNLALGALILVSVLTRLPA